MMGAAEIVARLRLETWSVWWCENCWRACWQGGLFILLAFVLCRLLPALSPRVRHGLWLLACVKLALGMFWAAPLPLPVPVNSLPAALVTPAPASSSPVPLLRGTGANVSSATAILPPAPAGTLISGRALLFLAWLCGLLFCGALAVREALALSRLCRRARCLEDTLLGAQARELGARMGLARVPHLREAETLSTPLVVGLLRPLILLPPHFAERFSPEEARLALAHELAHIRRGDLWLNLAPVLAQTLFFFFPPTWFACREWMTAREAVCDQDALAITHAPPAVYGNLLLKLVSQEKAPPANLLRGALGATANYHTLKTRLAWLSRQTRPARRSARLGRLAAAFAAVPGLLLLTPWHIRAASVPAPGFADAIASHGSAPATSEDPADTPALDLRAGGDPRKRYLLIGTRAPAPTDGYRLLVVLPGGAGGDDFQYFVKRVQARGLPPGYLIAELIAPQWSKAQAHDLVWPTRINTLPGVKFPTETFVEDVIRDVKTRYAVNSRYVFTLGWASGGPACYAAALQPNTQTRGAFIAMSVFIPASLPSLQSARNRHFFLHQPLDTDMAPLDMATQARSQLRAQGATVELTTYEGGYGWHGPVYAQIRRGVDWLEQKSDE